MENKLVPMIGKLYFMVIAVLMYYFLTEVINLGIFVAYRHAFALLLFASTFFAFLYKPNIARAATSIKATFVYCMPMIVITLVSLFIWFVGQVDTDIISRSLSAIFIYTKQYFQALVLSWRVAFRFISLVLIFTFISCTFPITARAAHDSDGRPTDLTNKLVLAIYKGDDFPQSKFIYDVSRDEGIARRIISNLNSKTPCIDGLLEAVSEML